MPPIPPKAGMIVPLTKIPLERVGATGSRVGPVTTEQETAARSLLLQTWPFKELHHGVAEGFDEWVHFAVRELFGRWGKGGPQIHGWPPTDRKFLSVRALRDLDVKHEAREYKARDREIGYHSQGLIAAPKEWSEIMHSGTWYTMRQAAAMLRPIWFVRVDGEIITDWHSEMSERVKGAEVEELAQHPFDFEVPEGREVPHKQRLALLTQQLPDDLDEAFGADPHGDLNDAFS